MPTLKSLEDESNLRKTRGPSKSLGELEFHRSLPCLTLGRKTPRVLAIQHSKSQDADEAKTALQNEEPADSPLVGMSSHSSDSHAC